MSIQPIDLQVLFSRLEQMGKEQAAQKEVSAQNQMIQGSELVKKTEQQNHSVNEARETEQDGVQRLKDENKKKSPRQPRREAKKKEESEIVPKTEVVKDPNLGKNIDLQG